jgi:hypothetical protein
MVDADDLDLIYTTAPAVLDVPGTKTIRRVAGETTTGKPVRLVGVPHDNRQDQNKAYVENFHFAYSPEDWKYEEQFGNVKSLTEEEGKKYANFGNLLEV